MGDWSDDEELKNAHLLSFAPFIRYRSALQTELKQPAPPPPPPQSTRRIHLRDVSKYISLTSLQYYFPIFQVNSDFFLHPPSPFFYFTGTLLQNIRNCKGTFVLNSNNSLYCCNIYNCQCHTMHNNPKMS